MLVNQQLGELILHLLSQEIARVRESTSLEPIHQEIVLTRLTEYGADVRELFDLRTSRTRVGEGSHVSGSKPETPMVVPPQNAVVNSPTPRNNAPSRRRSGNQIVPKLRSTYQKWWGICIPILATDPQFTNVQVAQDLAELGYPGVKKDAVRYFRKHHARYVQQFAQLRKPEQRQRFLQDMYGIMGAAPNNGQSQLSALGEKLLAKVGEA